MNHWKTLKVKYREMSDNYVFIETLNNEKFILSCNECQQNEFHALQIHLSSGNILNLLNVSKKSDDTLIAEFIIFEPDYLIDISSLAECFRPYGHHPLNYYLSRFRFVENTRHILLGNVANFFLDELINENDDNPINYNEALRVLFKRSPFEFTSCEDIMTPNNEKVFFDACKVQFKNIQVVVKDLFKKASIEKHKSILEPSFICNSLGLQGRLDLMLQDFSAFVELKSGKGVEDFRSGTFLNAAVNHYIQMILYLAVLEFNMGLNPDQINSFLLYSKYPILSKESHSRDQLQKAIALRNQIVALEYNIQQFNDHEYTRNLISKIRAEILNTANLSGNFFDNYLRPEIEKIKTSIINLNEQECLYFMRLFTFICKELWLSKVGERDYEGVKRAVNLWNAAPDEKIAAGEFLYDLQIIENRASSKEHFVTLSIPQYELDYLPNFRHGDAIILYVRNLETDNVNNKQVFKGAIELLDTKTVQVRLRARQSNPYVLPLKSKYALEHDYMDSTYNGMFRALSAFLNAKQDRRDLLLAQRMPTFNKMEFTDKSEDDNQIKQVIAKAMNAKDCFLLVGPPGTGKTSLALKQMVEACINKGENILLLSYTNRAVDEICQTLISIDEDLNFIRIGNELNCSSEYKEHLLENKLNNCTRRSEVKSIIENCHIFIGTVASVWNKHDLFNIKCFETAIIDEATQLLEPHLLGILCLENNSGKNIVNRFILIGDHKQLPAIVLQSKDESRVNETLLHEAGLFDLSNSLFERLYHKYKEIGLYESFDVLTKQGRMHPEISGFSSDFFYNGKLNSACLPHQTEMWDRVENIDCLEDMVVNSRLAFITSDSLKKGNNDKINQSEVDIVIRIATTLFNHYYQKNIPFHRNSLGIITPYRSQIALIRKELQRSGISQLIETTVDTVERFQGSQKDVIIYSFCVNAGWQLDSLPNIMEEEGKMIDRKLNVALTRARKQLFLTGNVSLLSQNDIYLQLINYIRKNGVFI